MYFVLRLVVCVEEADEQSISFNIVFFAQAPTYLYPPVLMYRALHTKLEYVLQQKSKAVCFHVRPKRSYKIGKIIKSDKFITAANCITNRGDNHHWYRHKINSSSLPL